MYEKITTKGIIVKTQDQGEAHRILWIVTEDLGLVRVYARSLRRDVSKLRYHSQYLTHARFTFVRGARMWQLVGAEGLEGPVSWSRAHARVADMVADRVHGEEPQDGLYALLYDVWHALAWCHPDDVHVIARVACGHVYKQLGYWPDTVALPKIGVVPSQQEDIAITRTIKELDKDVDTGALETPRFRFGLVY